MKIHMNVEPKNTGKMDIGVNESCELKLEQQMAARTDKTRARLLDPLNIEMCLFVFEEDGQA